MNNVISKYQLSNKKHQGLSLPQWISHSMSNEAIRYPYNMGINR